MIKFIYSVRDVKTFFADPFVDVSDDSAIRGFCYMLKNQPNIIGFAPADFSLWKIGKFDSKTGIVEYILPELIYQPGSVDKEYDYEA